MAKKSDAKLYREKYNLVQKINKRIRDTVNRIGTKVESVQIFEMSITLSGRAVTTAYSENDEEYLLLSRSKKDIESYSLEDLKLLESQTPQWKITKSEITREIEEERKNIPPEKRKPITLEDIKKQASITRAIHEMFEENADLFYMMIDSTGWDDIKEHTTEEIYQRVKSLKDQLDAGATYNWSAPPEAVGESYIARRDQSRADAAMNRALQASYFEE